ncbi:synaptic plasticity regulator PANTS isoform X1 [Eschrichtius robustus]|uniref:synaptic plasticity regulator PANTS isoform X1 n=1 Tax=Eschrichtius robustus TaxID=9764 RepID=UPI0035C23D37
MAEGGGWQPPRPCEAYRAEWELCSSAGHFLRHYYVHGDRPACGQWRRDLDSCREWEERRSAEAQVTRPGVPSPERPGTSPGARDAGRRGRALKKGFDSSLHVCWGACFDLYP